MQEHAVTVQGQTMRLVEPFFVLATQNPIEQEGTYPLPEAQLDRFMFNLWIDYPSREEEVEIVRRTTGAEDVLPSKILDAEGIITLQNLVRRVPAADDVVTYAVELVRSSRPEEKGAPAFIREWVKWGAGPRASQYLILGAKARAALEGRFAPSKDDVRAVAMLVLRHRLVTTFAAEAEGVSAPDIVEKLIEESRTS
jgi:MoxR-like ATPase